MNSAEKSKHNNDLRGLIGLTPAIPVIQNQVVLTLNTVKLTTPAKSPKPQTPVIINSPNIDVLVVPVVQHDNKMNGPIVQGETKVVCVKVNDIRPKYHDLGEWMEDPNNLYIGRKGVVFITRNDTKIRFPEKDSIWSNPYKIAGTLTRENVIELYRNHIINKIRTGEISTAELEKLRGKNLGCWCKENGQNIQCHGDILLELLELNKQGVL